MATQPKDISEQLQAAIRADGRSLNKLARACGVDVSVLSRFLAGERGMNLESAGKLARLFGLELRPVRKGGK